MLTITINQNNGSNDVTLNTTTEFEFDLNATKSNVSKAVGTLCNEVFRTMDLYKQMNSRFLACNSPVNIRMKLGRTVIDTGTVARDLQSGLKVGYTWKQRKRFALNTFALVQFMLHAVTTHDVDEFTALCDERINKGIADLLKA